MNKEIHFCKGVCKKNNLHPWTVQLWCANGRIKGAYKFGVSWAVPDMAPRPKEHRYKK